MTTQTNIIVQEWLHHFKQKNLIFKSGIFVDTRMKHCRTILFLFLLKLSIMMQMENHKKSNLLFYLAVVNIIQFSKTVWYPESLFGQCFHTLAICSQIILAQNDHTKQ